MKRISFLLVTLALCGTPGLRAQDAATEERLNKLSGQIENILETQQALRKQLDQLAKEIDAVREKASQPTGNYAAQEDLKALAKAVEQVDQKRIKDAETVSAQLANLRTALLKAPPPSSRKNGSSSTPKASDDTPSTPQTGYEYVVQSGDTLSTIVAAYQEKNVKVTMAQVLKANPGLKPEKMRVGQKIFIPAPK